MSKTTPKGSSAATYHTTYQANNTFSKNREKKLRRELKRNPKNAAQTELALKNIHYRRKTPKAPLWSHSKIATAKLLKLFMGRCTKKVFASDPDVASAALKDRRGAFEALPMPKRSIFSIWQRAKDKTGAYLWA